MDLVLLDADIAGCVHTWLGNRGRLDDWRKGVLASSRLQLELVMPCLAHGEEQRYFGRLEKLVALTTIEP